MDSSGQGGGVANVESCVGLGVRKQERPKFCLFSRKSLKTFEKLQPEKRECSRCLRLKPSKKKLGGGRSRGKEGNPEEPVSVFQLQPSRP